jgi:hypothetical protein
MKRDSMRRLIQIASWILLYLPLALILFLAVDFLNYVITYGAGVASRIFLNILSVIVFLAILMVVSGWLSSISDRIEDDIEMQLVGFLLSAPSPIHIEKIAKYLNISVGYAAKTFFKVKSKKMLKEFTFDSERMEIIPPATQAMTTVEKPSYTSHIVDELLRKAKLMELERLKEEGKISEKAYKKIREELEGKQP